MIDHVDQTSFQIVFVLTSSSLLSNLSGHFYNSKLQANMGHVKICEAIRECGGEVPSRLE